MPVTQKRKPKGLPKRTGKRHAKIVASHDRLLTKRYARNLRHSGPAAAAAWASAHHYRP